MYSYLDRDPHRMFGPAKIFPRSRVSEVSFETRKDLRSLSALDACQMLREASHHNSGYFPPWPVQVMSNHTKMYVFKILDLSHQLFEFIMDRY